ncbi:tetratricopeptide repeat family protein [Rickettsia parkeri str. Tate's Hell]|nr:tetratricopeptide repeat family protein [Rickettsia parkeri str. AT\
MYSKIHKSSNYYQEAQYYLGECYLNQEEFTEAVEAYNKVNKNHYLFEKASSNISVIEQNFDLINSK